MVLSGDTHNAWANDLQDMSGNQVGVEFATASVSSPGLEEYLPDDPETVAAGLTALIEPLQYANTQHRGYMVVNFTPAEARADWYFVSTIKAQAYTLLDSYQQSLKVLPGNGNRTIVPV